MNTECSICGRTMPFAMSCERCDDPRYAIIRFYKDAGIRRRIIRTGVTIRQAQAHCNDPETSSSTATSPSARARTKRVGEWFDGWSNMGTATMRRR